jgi:putative ABC transport system permease protein
VIPRLAAARLVARLAWRETRGAQRHFAYSLACIAIGVAALVAVQSFADSLAGTVARSAKSLLGGDVEIRSARPLSANGAATVSRLGAEGIGVTRVRELVAMAQAEGVGHTQIVELKAVESGYPLYGRLGTDPPRSLPSLVGQGRALVHASLLSRLGLTVGDRLRIGRLDFTISGVITEEPDRVASIFSLGPRVMIGSDDLDRTGLVRPGSRVRYRTLLRLDGADAEAFRDELARRLPDPAIRLVTYTQAQPGLRRFWTQLTLYLGLAGLVVLMVGGIGVAVSVSAFVRDKRSTIAVLKCLGASRREVLAIYLGQTALLGLGGSLAGAVLGSALQPLLSPLLARLLPFPVHLTLSPRAVLSGLAMGVGVTLLFSLWPLGAIRRLPPALILRSQVESSLTGRRPWAAALIVAAGLSALALWQAGSWRIGGLFIGGLALAFVGLALSARLIIAASRRARRGSLAWRQGMGNLHRPGSQAATIVVALGLAVMLIVCVMLLERSLRQELRDTSAGTAPAFFFIDIQPDQAERFSRLVTDLTGGVAPDLTPVVRSRLVAVNGTPIPPAARSGREDAWYLTREYVLTWAARPPHHNRVTAGRWWTAAEAASAPLISVEEDVARQLGVGLGGTLTFDIQGVAVTATVMNLRHVDWNSFNSNFFVIFSPGPLDGAPSTSIATARVPPAAETRVQTAVVAAFPNVTAIPVREVIERATTVLDQIALAMRLVAGLAVVSGLVVTAGALAVTRYQRLYQSVILKTLGATRGVVAGIFAVEYALLGAGAGIGGTVLAAGLAWAVLRFALDMPWSWAPATLLAGVAAAVALAVAVGALGTYRLLGEKPLRVLRSE